MLTRLPAVGWSAVSLLDILQNPHVLLGQWNSAVPICSCKMTLKHRQLCYIIASLYCISIEAKDIISAERYWNMELENKKFLWLVQISTPQHENQSLLASVQIKLHWTQATFQNSSSSRTPREEEEKISMYFYCCITSWLVELSFPWIVSTSATICVISRLRAEHPLNLRNVMSRKCASLLQPRMKLFITGLFK